MKAGELFPTSRFFVFHYFGFNEFATNFSQNDSGEIEMNFISTANFI